MDYLEYTLNQFVKEGIEKTENLDIKGLKKIVEKIIHCIVIYRKKYLVDLFIYFYSLGKIFEILDVKNPNEKYKIKDKLLEFFIDFSNCKDDKCREEKIEVIKNLVKSYEIVYNQYYLEKIEEKAKSKLGFLLYKHGISLKTIAEKLGIDLGLLQKYIGRTNIIYDSPSLYDIKKRIEEFEKYVDRQ